MVRQPQSVVKGRAQERVHAKQNQRLKPRQPMEYDSREAASQALRDELTELERQFEDANLIYEAEREETSDERIRAMARLLELRMKVARMEGRDTWLCSNTRQQFREALERRERGKDNALPDVAQYAEDANLDRFSDRDLEGLLRVARRGIEEELPRLIEKEEEAEEPNAEFIAHLKARLQKFEDAARNIERYVEDRRSGKAPSQSNGRVPPQKQPTASSPGRRNLTRLLYDHYKGHYTQVFEWAIVAVREAFAAQGTAKTKDDVSGPKPSEKGKAAVKDGRSTKAVKDNGIGNMILILARLAYWSEPPRDGEPPRADERYRVRDKKAVWWLVLSPAVLGRQVGLSKKAAQTALAKLARVKIIEAKKRDELDLGDVSAVDYGPNALFVRIRAEWVESVIPSRMDRDKASSNRARRGERG